MPSLGMIRRAILFFRDAWEVTASGTTTDGTFEVLLGNSKTFTNNLGSPPVCYYDYDLQGHIIGTHYATYQWYLDGAAVGRGATSYTVAAQTRGTSHTISCSWTCVGLAMSLIQGATITVYDSNGILVFSGISDANGEVAISALDRGTYNIQVSKTGYATTTYAINITEYKTYVLNLPATSNTIYAMMVTEAMSETPAISKNTSVTEILAEIPSVGVGLSLSLF